eukprot:8902870-Prorocentrum_lima.AAC.1
MGEGSLRPLACGVPSPWCKTEPQNCERRPLRTVQRQERVLATHWAQCDCAIEGRTSSKGQRPAET